MNDREESNALFNTNVQGWAGNSQYWFALTQLPGSAEPAGGWTNYGGCPSVLQTWSSGEPNDANGEDCTHSYTTGLWNDLNCNTEKEYVCEFQLDACQSDSDGDLILDECEVPGYEHNPDISAGLDGAPTPDLGEADPADVICDDRDNDGVCDRTDAFPDDPTESADTDGDGVGDNADAFPNDPTEDTDTDGDGIGDNADAFPNDPLNIAPCTPDASPAGNVQRIEGTAQLIWPRADCEASALACGDTVALVGGVEYVELVSETVSMCEVAAVE